MKVKFSANVAFAEKRLQMKKKQKFLRFELEVLAFCCKKNKMKGFKTQIFYPVPEMHKQGNKREEKENWTEFFVQFCF